MSHVWTYRGGGNYGCVKCGQAADKSNVAEISTQDCPADAGNEEIAVEMAQLGFVVEALNKRVKKIEDKQEVAVK
ncbi:hypothetical protein ES705_33266 [subsurface metagenome]